MLDDGLIDCEAVVAPLSNHFCLTAVGLLVEDRVLLSEAEAEAADLLPLTAFFFSCFRGLEAVIDEFLVEPPRLDSLSPLLPFEAAAGRGGEEGVLGMVEAEGVEDPVEDISE